MMHMKQKSNSFRKDRLYGAHVKNRSTPDLDERNFSFLYFFWLVGKTSRRWEKLSVQSGKKYGDERNKKIAHQSSMFRLFIPGETPGTGYCNAS